MPPLYTVIIPTYNRRDTLAAVLAALAEQDALELLDSVVVVDDGSSDGTPEALGALRFPFALRVLTGRRGGPAAARNAGIAAANTPLVLFLCDDIVPTPGLLREHHRRREGVQGPHCVVGRMDWPPGTAVTPFMQFVQRYYHFGPPPAEGVTELDFAGFVTANLSVATDLLTEHGGFDAGFPYGFEDTDLGLRLTRAGTRILYAPAALAYHHHVITVRAYCARQEAVGESAVVFARKHPDHPEVVRLDRLPRAGSLRGVAKSVLINSATRPLLVSTAGLLDAVGLARLAHPLYFQLLSYHYYRGVRRALTRGQECQSE